MLKFNFGSNTRPRCLWDSERLTSFPLKMREGWMTLDFFLENKNSCAIFVGSGLKDIFHCCAHLFIFSRSLFWFAVVPLTFLTTENKDVSSAKSLVEQRSSKGRSFM